MNMNFKKITAQKAKKTILKGRFDFGDGIGEQDFFVRRLKYAERQDLFTTRLKEDGSGLKLTGEDSAKYFSSELLARHLCDEKGDPVITAEELREWDSEDLDALNEYVGLLLAPKKDEGKDPSAATS